MNKEAGYIHNKILFSNKEQGYPATYDNMNGPRGHYYAKWNKPEKSKNCMLSHVFSVKQKTKQLIGKELRFMATRGGGIGRNWRKVVKSYNLPVTR